MFLSFMLLELTCFTSVNNCFLAYFVMWCSFLHHFLFTTSCTLWIICGCGILTQDFMSGKVAFRNIMNIILVGVDSLINERTTQTYGILLEKAVHLSLEIFILVMERDLALADVFRPLYQVLYFAYLSYGFLPGHSFI